MADRAPITKLDEHGVPHCTGARCPHRTPKDRCAITGEAIESTCQPAVRAMVRVVTAADDLDAELYGMGGSYGCTRDALHEALCELRKIRKPPQEVPMRAVSNADTSTTGNG